MCWNGLLLLVSFYTPWMGNLEQSHFDAITNSPYHGVAVPLIEQFNTDPVSFDQLVKLGQFEPKVQERIIPWVYFNRFVGLDKNKKPRHKKSKKPYFEQINGIDIFDKTGSLSDFKKIFKAALVLAKNSTSNSLVLDPEVYNDYETYKLSYLSKKLGISKKELMNRLTEIGYELTDIAAEVNKDATIWYLLSGLGGGRIGLGNKRKDRERSITYIIKGMISRAEEKQLNLKFISGGELTLGYCYKNMSDLNNMISKREKRFESNLKQYSSLELGSTIAPWFTKSSKKSWMTRGRCKRSNFDNINDFKTPISTLMKNYDYLWIYGAVAGNFNIYNPRVAPKINNLVSQTIREARAQCQ